MDFFEVVKNRRSIRKFKTQYFPDQYVEKALEAAILAPNSSNTQTWDFHWVRSSKAKESVAQACLSQSAARTASHLIVVVADPGLWRRSQKSLLQWAKEAKAPKSVLFYYHKLIPYTYRWGPLNSFALFKMVVSSLVGLFRPITRRPHTRRDLEEVAIKSAALAAENFVLAITAQGGATCMMEGFDERRLKRLLPISRSSRVVMVIAVGFEGERGTWGPRFRLPSQQVIHIY